MTVKTSFKQMVKRDGTEWRPDFDVMDDVDWETYRTTVRNFNVTVTETDEALREIWGRMLWAHEYDSFAAYLKKEFPFGVRMAQQMAADERVRLEFDDPECTIPGRHLRALGPLVKAGRKDLVPEAYATAQATACNEGRVTTTEDVEFVVETLQPKTTTDPELANWNKLDNALQTAAVITNLLNLTDHHNTVLSLQVKVRKDRKLAGWTEGKADA